MELNHYYNSVSILYHSLLLQYIVTVCLSVVKSLIVECDYFAITRVNIDDLIISVVLTKGDLPKFTYYIFMKYVSNNNWFLRIKKCQKELKVQIELLEFIY